MANNGIIHLSTTCGGKAYCGNRKAHMSTTEDRVKIDGWTRVCVKCEVVRLRHEEIRKKRAKEGK